MAQFGGTDISKIEGERPIAPAAPDRSALAQASGQMAVANVIGQLGQIGVGLFQELKTQEQNKAIASFSQSQLALADAVDQGRISSQEARMRMRANFSEVIANNPALFNELAKTHNTIVTTSGLGKVVQEGTAQEQRQLKLRDDALAAGFGRTDGTVSEADMAEFLEFDRAQSQLEQMAKIQSVHSTSLTIDDKVQEAESRRALSSFAAKSIPIARNRIEALIQNFNPKSASPEELNQFQFAVNQLSSEVRALGTRISGGRNSEYVNQLLAPFQGMADYAIDYSNGKITADQLQNRLSSMKAFAEINFLQDNEDIARAAPVFEMLKGIDGAASFIRGKRVFSALQEAFDGKRMDIDGMTSEDIQNLSEATNRVNKDAVQGSQFNTEENLSFGAEATNKQFLEGLARSEDLDSEQLVGVLKHLSDPRFGAYMEENGQIMEASADRAFQAINNTYLDSIRASLFSEYQNVSIVPGAGPGPGSRARNIQEFIEPVFGAAGIGFRVRPDVELPQGASFSELSGNLNSLVRSLNRSLAPKINTVNRALAHMTRSRDYKKTWEEFWGPMMFPLEFGPEEGVQEGSQQEGK